MLRHRNDRDHRGLDTGEAEQVAQPEALVGPGVFRYDIDVELEPLELAPVDQRADGVAKAALVGLGLQWAGFARFEGEVVAEVEVDGLLEDGGERLDGLPPRRIGVLGHPGALAEAGQQHLSPLKRP